MGACPSAASVAYKWVTGAPTSSKPDWDYDDVAFSDEDDDLLDLDLPGGSVKLSRSNSRVSSASPSGSEMVVHDDHFDDDRLRLDEDSHLEDSCDEASRGLEDRSARIGGQSLSQAAASTAAVAKATNAVVGRQPELSSALPSQVGSTGRTAQIGSFVSSIFRRDSPQRTDAVLQFSSDQPSAPSTDHGGGPVLKPTQPSALISTADLTSWIDDPRQLRDMSYTYHDDDEEDFDAFLESVRATTLMGTSRSTCSTPDTGEVASASTSPVVVPTAEEETR